MSKQTNRPDAMSVVLKELLRLQTECCSFSSRELKLQREIDEMRLALPVKPVVTSDTRTCVIDLCDHPSSEGVLCSGKGQSHCYCRACFEGNVRHQCEPWSRGHLADQAAQVACLPRAQPGDGRLVGRSVPPRRHRSLLGRSGADVPRGRERKRSLR